MSGISSGTDNKALGDMRDLMTTLVDSSKRLEKDTVKLNTLTLMLAAETLVLIVFTIVGFIRL